MNTSNFISLFNDERNYSITVKETNNFVITSCAPKRILNSLESTNVFPRDLLKFLTIIFPSFKNPNSIQNQVLPLLNKNQSLVVSAPTGTGKTVLAVSAIWLNTDKTPSLLANSISFYLVPTRALLNEKKTILEKAFPVAELGEDTSLLEVSVILCTFERFGLFARKASSGLRLAVAKRLTLVVVDEFQTLLDFPRAASFLDAFFRLGKPKILGLTAGIVKTFAIDKMVSILNCSLKTFGEEYRPVPVTRTLYFSKENKDPLNSENCRQLVTSLVSDSQKSTIIFVRSRKAAEQLAAKFGFARPHHAGLPISVRTEAERLFRKKQLRVLVATSTLAAGVNLPADMVVVLGTTVFREGRFEEISSLELAQLFGRAGRMGLSETGTAVLISSRLSAKKHDEKTEKATISACEVFLWNMVAPLKPEDKHFCMEALSLESSFFETKMLLEKLCLLEGNLPSLFIEFAPSLEEFYLLDSVCKRLGRARARLNYIDAFFILINLPLFRNMTSEKEISCCLSGFIAGILSDSLSFFASLFAHKAETSLNTNIGFFLTLLYVPKEEWHPEAVDKGEFVSENLGRVLNLFRALSAEYMLGQVTAVIGELISNVILGNRVGIAQNKFLQTEIAKGKYFQATISFCFVDWKQKNLELIRRLNKSFQVFLMIRDGLGLGLLLYKRFYVKLDLVDGRDGKCKTKISFELELPFENSFTCIIDICLDEISRCQFRKFIRILAS